MGWMRGRTGLLVEKLTGKKKKLVVRLNGEAKVIATFKDDESAELFDKVLDYLIEGKKHG